MSYGVTGHHSDVISLGNDMIGDENKIWDTEFWVAQRIVDSSKKCNVDRIKRAKIQKDCFVLW